MKKERKFRVRISNHCNTEFICGKIIGAISALVKFDRKSDAVTEIIYKNFNHPFRYFSCKASDEEWAAIKEYMSRYDYDIKYIEIIEE